MTLFISDPDSPDPWADAAAHVSVLAALQANWDGSGERVIHPMAAGWCTALLAQLETAFNGTGVVPTILVDMRSCGDVTIGINANGHSWSYWVGEKNRVAIDGATDWARGDDRGQPAVDALVSEMLATPGTFFVSAERKS